MKSMSSAPKTSPASSELPQLDMIRLDMNRESDRIKAYELVKAGKRYRDQLRTIVDVKREPKP